MKLQAMEPLKTSLDVWVGRAGRGMASLREGREDSSTLQAKFLHLYTGSLLCPDLELDNNEESLR